MRRVAFLAALGLAAAGCGGTGNAPQVEFRVPVVVQTVGTGTVEDRIVTTGTLRAPEAIALRAETGGALLIAQGAGGRRLSEGDRVTAGQEIAAITGEEVRLAARLESTRQRYESAKQDRDSGKRLYDEGLLSDEAIRTLETALADAQTEWERSQLTLFRSRLVTPIAGVILRLARDEAGLPMADGQLVTAGAVVAQVGPTTRLVADIDLVGPDVARARVGQAAHVRYHAGEQAGFEGRVVRLAPSIDPATRTLRAEVEVANREGVLRPGMFVEVTLVAERRENVAVVPREAVTERGGRKVVFVLDGQKVNRREVGIGLGDDETVEILMGVEPGERVVVRGLETLTDGASVRVSGA